MELQWEWGDGAVLPGVFNIFELDQILPRGGVGCGLTKFREEQEHENDDDKR